MDRKACERSIEKLNNYKHYTVDAYKDLTKVIQYLLYEIDELKDREAEPPSIYGSMADEPNYRDFPDDKSEGTVELDECEISASYIDDTTIPLVLASNSMLIPFHTLPSEPEEKGAEEDVKEPVEDVPAVPEESPREPDVAEVAWTITKDDTESVKAKPKRLRVVGETDKTNLHNGGLKRVKENLRASKKKKPIIIDGDVADS